MIPSSERNRRIKKVLSEIFGRDNVSVKGARGTAYGWVYIFIKIPKITDCNCGKPYGDHLNTCEKWRNTVAEIESKVEKALKDSNLLDEIGTYYTDMGFKQKEYDVFIREVET